MEKIVSVDLKALTAEIITAHVSHNSVETASLPDLIKGVHEALAQLGKEAASGPEVPFPMEGKVTARKSLSDPAKIISMIDGKPYSTLKRHITLHGYTPESYREAFGLKADYPMVAPGYAARRSELAKTIGLGRKPKEAAPVAPEPEAPAEPPKKARKPRKAVSKATEPTSAE